MNQQKLRDIQQQIDPNIKHPLDIVKFDKDWSSIYCAIYHLIILQPSIQYFSIENKKLKENMFSDDELDICRELDIILNLFHELTKMLKGSKYPALSFMTPAIKNLKQHLNIYQPKNNVLRYQIFEKLREQFMELVKPVAPNNLENDSDSKMLTFFQIYFQENVQTKFDKYLELSQLPVTEENNSLAWWHENKHLFLMMAKFARKYLTILAFSAPNRVSDIKNHNLDLDIDLVNQIIFSKHNLL
ncbi:33665_t:CDS:2 [Gigaspora margarita]|uniref:33665_t:CDS:1 n=1 Tax=Gigaspora margarita TaxID=4874 RepID=A0ABN7WGG3_GIGMA|nr:33665_t:CDS:2 [Gigaspora margarita]